MYIIIYSATGATSSATCSGCVAGKYSSFTGASDISTCKTCVCGTYCLTTGCTSCSNCPPSQYMLPDTSGSFSAGDCINCQAGLTSEYHRPACGAQTCMSSPVVAVNAGAFDSIESSTAYVVITILTLAPGGLGYLVNIVRRKEPRVVVLTLLSISQHMGLSCASLASEFSLMVILFGSGYVALGILIVLARLLHLIPTGYTVLRVFGPDYISDKEYGSLMAKDHFMSYSYMYAALSFLSLLEAPFLAYLPWYHSDFASQSKGYPDMFTLRLALYTKIGQSLVLLICNSVFLVKSRSSNMSLSVRGVFYLNIVVSTASAILAAMHVMMRSSILKDVPIKEPSLKSVEGGVGMTDIKKGMDEEVGGGNFKSSSNSSVELSTLPAPITQRRDTIPPTIDTTTSPLHSECAVLPKDNISAYEAHEDGTNSKNAESLKWNSKMTIRDWILNLIPNIDGPTLHAVSECFRGDDINTVDEMIVCNKGGVLDIADIKGYMTKGKMSKLRQVQIINSFKEIVSELS